MSCSNSCAPCTATGQHVPYVATIHGYYDFTGAKLSGRTKRKYVASKADRCCLSKSIPYACCLK